MAKNRSAAGITNIIQYDANKNITFVSGSTTLLTVSSSGALTTSGTITATTLVVQTVTSSVNFITGSTKFGSISANTHTFSGSMYVTGCINLNSGSLLVGTNSPIWTNGTTRGVVEINGPSQALLGFDVAGSGAGYLYHDGTNMTLNNGLTGYLRFNTDGAERMRISSTGNIGIGTTSPVSTSLNGSVTIVKTYGNDTPTSTTAQTYDINQSNLYLFGRNAGLTMVGNNGEEAIIAFANASAYYIGGIRYDMGTTSAGGAMKFQTGGTNERMRITSAGYICMNTTTATTTLNLKAQSDNRVIFFHNPNGADGSIWLYGASNSFDYKFSTWSQGSAFYLYNNGNYSFAGSNVSDRRLKENIKSITYSAIEKIMQLVPKSYNMVTQSEIIRNGFIAQEVKEVLPDVITGTETDDEYLGLDYNGLLAVAIKAIQELKAQNDSLQSQINELKA